MTSASGQLEHVRRNEPSFWAAKVTVRLGSALRMGEGSTGTGNGADVPAVSVSAGALGVWSHEMLCGRVRACGAGQEVAHLGVPSKARRKFPPSDNRVSGQTVSLAPTPRPQATHRCRLLHERRSAGPLLAQQGGRSSSSGFSRYSLVKSPTWCFLSTRSAQSRRSKASSLT
jgi:hypothetical protein